MSPIYIADIDGTLADLTERLHFIQQTPKDWDSFFDACGNDMPIRSVISVVQSLMWSGYTVLFVTGRPRRILGKTVGWLTRNGLVAGSGLVPGSLFMRKDGDHREDAIVKKGLLSQIRTLYPGVEISGVFEDRKQVVDMYRAEGLRVFQVAPGDF